MHSKLLVLSALCAFSFNVQNCLAAPQSAAAAPVSAKGKAANGQAVPGHKFMGWHTNYHNANVFFGKDKAVMDNGICKFLLTADQPKRLLIYDEDGKAYVEMSPVQWFNKECGEIPPAKLLSTKPAGKDKLFDVPCTRFDCYSKEGKKAGTYWATTSLGIDPRLTNAFAEFLGTPVNCGLPLKLEFEAKKFHVQYVSRNAPRKKNATYKATGKNTLVEMIPYTETITFATLKSHSLGQRPLKDFILPSDTKRAKSMAELIYGEGGQMTERNIDMMMASPMKHTRAKPAQSK